MPNNPLPPHNPLPLPIQKIIAEYANCSFLIPYNHKPIFYWFSFRQLNEELAARHRQEMLRIMYHDKHNPSFSNQYFNPETSNLAYFYIWIRVNVFLLYRYILAYFEYREYRKEQADNWAYARFFLAYPEKEESVDKSLVPQVP